MLTCLLKYKFGDNPNKNIRKNKINQFQTNQHTILMQQSANINLFNRIHSLLRCKNLIKHVSQTLDENVMQINTVKVEYCFTVQLTTELLRILLLT